MTNAFGAILSILILFSVGCQTPPTKTFETKPNTAKDEKALIGENTVLVDARPPFLSAIARPSGSIELQWQDFAQKEPPFEGYLEKDLFFHARRLARLGIGPGTDVLVLGRGEAGEGEEGRLAWTLRRLGLRNVRFASIDAVNWPLARDQAPARAEVPIWKPQPDPTLEVGRLEALELLKKEANATWVLDVRDPSDYLKGPQVFDQLRVTARIINVPWIEFIEARGRPDPSVKQKLAAVGVAPSDRLLVIDEKGVRSATATLVLRDLGFDRATNWTGGYREIRWFLGKR